MNKLRLPWDIPDGCRVFDSEKFLIFGIEPDADHDQIDHLIFACNEHADLTVNVSELKHVLEQRNQEKAALQAEVKKLRVLLKRSYYYIQEYFEQGDPIGAIPILSDIAETFTPDEQEGGSDE